MNRLKLLVSTLIAVAMLVGLGVTAQAQESLQLAGEITAITPAEGGYVITIQDEGGGSSDVFVPEDITVVVEGETLTPADLEVGWTVAVTVTQQDGTLYATGVTVGGEDDEDDEECEDCQHPVATQLAEYLGVPYEELMAYHDAGVGFGLLARAYFLADTLADEGFTVDDVLAMKESGEGFGYFLHEYGIHPGSYSLGAIMSGKGPQWKHTVREHNNNAFGQTNTPPGQAKKDEAGQDWTPPGQAKKGEADQDWTPPGQAKKDKTGH
jgi:hypothetical protein